MNRLLKQILGASIGGLLALSNAVCGFASELSTPQGFYGTTGSGVDMDGISIPIPKLIINWNPVSGAEGYEVWCRDITEGNDFYSDWYISQNTTATTAEEWIIDGYLQVKVRAYGNSGYSSYTDTITFLGGEGITDGPAGSTQSITTGWIKDGTGWWYQRADGSYPKSQWESVNGAWYYFNNSGYMQTGWIQDNGKYYYLNSSGVMLTNCTTPDGYKLDSNGVWIQDNHSNDLNDNYRTALFNSLSENKDAIRRRGGSFALLDINKDGINELIINIGDSAYGFSEIYSFFNSAWQKTSIDEGVVERYLESTKAVLAVHGRESRFALCSYNIEDHTAICNYSLNQEYDFQKEQPYYTENNLQISETDYSKREKFLIDNSKTIKFYDLTETNINSYTN